MFKKCVDLGTFGSKFLEFFRAKLPVFTHFENTRPRLVDQAGTGIFIKTGHGSVFLV